MLIAQLFLELTGFQFVRYWVPKTYIHIKWNVAYFFRCIPVEVSGVLLNQLRASLLHPAFQATEATEQLIYVQPKLDLDGNEFLPKIPWFDALILCLLQNPYFALRSSAYMII